MPDLLNVREAGRRTIRLLRFQDGLWDILLGVAFLLMSIYPITRALLGPTWNAVAVGLALSALFAGAAWARVVLVIPRRGVATPRPGTMRTMTIAFRLTLFLALVTAVLWTLFATSLVPSPPWGTVPDWVNTLAPEVVVALLLVLILSLVARSAGLGRIYVYGWLLGLGNLASSALQHYKGYRFGFPLAIAAGIVLMVGVFVFVRFLREFPAPRSVS